MNADPVAQVRHAFESVGRGELAPLTELLAPDVVYTLIGSTPVSGTHRGRDAVARHLFGPLTAALAGPLVFTIQRLLRDGDCVVMQAQGHARLRSGAPYDNVYCLVFRFGDGVVREVTEYLDTGLVQRAFGVPPTAEQLLRAMDLNCWEMYREIARAASGSEVLDTPRCSLLWTPRGTPFHNAVLVRGAIDLDELLELSRRFHGARQREGDGLGARPRRSGAGGRAAGARLRDLHHDARHGAARRSGHRLCAGGPEHRPTSIGRASTTSAACRPTPTRPTARPPSTRTTRSRPSRASARRTCRASSATSTAPPSRRPRST